MRQKSLSYREITNIHPMPPLITSLYFQSVFQIALLFSQLILINKQGLWCSCHLLPLGLNFSICTVGVAMPAPGFLWKLT